MSVQVVDLDVYAAVCRKLNSYKDLNVVNINYNHWGKRMKKGEAEQFIKRLITLNELTYNQAYPNESDKPYMAALLPDVGKAINAYQMLKFLECIDYNISIPEIKNLPDTANDDMVLLKKIIDECRKQIIETLPEYEAAQWSSL